MTSTHYLTSKHYLLPTMTNVQKISYPKSSIKYYSLFVIFIFIIYPFAALPLIIYEIYKGKRYAFSLLAIYIGYFALLYPPAGDLYRYRNDYYEYKDISFEYFKSLLIFNLDYCLSFLLFLLGKLNIPSDFSRFIYAWIGSELLFDIFYDITHNFRQKKPNKTFILFIIYWLYASFTALMYRHGFSSALFSYGFYSMYYKHQKIQSYLLLVLAALNHFSYIVFILAIIAQKCLSFKGNRILSIICVICMFSLSADFLSSFISSLPLPEFATQRLLAYTEGYWAQEFVEDLSFKGNILRLFNKMRILSLIAIYICCFTQDSQSGFLSIGLCICALFSMSNTILSRFEVALLVPFMINFLNLAISDRLTNYKKTTKLFLLIGLFSAFTSFWSHRREYSISYEYKLFLPTSINIISTHYSQNWVNDHIYDNGEPIGLY